MTTQTITIWPTEDDNAEQWWMVTLGNKTKERVISVYLTEAEALIYGRAEARRRGIALMMSAGQGSSTEVCSVRQAMIEQHLLSLGVHWTGGYDQLPMIAQRWMDAGFDADTMKEWTKIGVWEPRIAQALANTGMSAKQIRKTIDDQPRYIDEADVIYQLCAGCADIDTFIYWLQQTYKKEEI